MRPARWGGGVCGHDIVRLLLYLIPMTLTATLGTISFSGPDGSAIASFWPAAALQIVFSIWFGVPGAAAGIVGPMLGNALVGGSPLLYVPANAVQSILPGVIFRRLKLDPRLRSRRDWAGLIVLCCVLSNALGAALGVGEAHFRAGQAGAWWPRYAATPATPPPDSTWLFCPPIAWHRSAGRSRASRRR